MKNIILCADGTGNQGGYTPDSNVFKLYNAIDLNTRDPEQICFYDNGVGTQSNKYVRGLSGALGFWYKRNVRDVYEYLARHYDPDDNVYLFGFSRGAAEIRAVNGFIDACGLIDGRGKGDKQLKDEVKKAMKVYARPHKREALLGDVKIHAAPPAIAFIGVWDTVSALGFPERTDIAGIGLRILSWLLKQFGKLANLLIPHKFYNYKLTPNVTKARHALSLDDERTSFWPLVWDEDTDESKPVDVQQVWFAGMHSNVGGGYRRSGLSNAAYLWMLENIRGLVFKKDTLRDAEDDANVNGRIYDSRLGFAIYYRYHPREISKLCKEANTEVKVHESVLRRLRFRTANYAPKLLPESFTVIDNEGITTASPPVHSEHWALFNKGIKRWIAFRKWLYGMLLELTLGVLIISTYLWSTAKGPLDVKADTNDVADVLYYITPEFFEQLIYITVVRDPEWILGAAIVFSLFIAVRMIALRKTTRYAERLRKLIIRSPLAHPDYPASASPDGATALNVDQAESPPTIDAPQEEKL